jgi:hypothetical protein
VSCLLCRRLQSIDLRRLPLDGDIDPLRPEHTRVAPAVERFGDALVFGNGRLQHAEAAFREDRFKVLSPRPLGKPPLDHGETIVSPKRLAIDENPRRPEYTSRDRFFAMSTRYDFDLGIGDPT